MVQLLNTYRLTSITSVKLIGTQLAIVYLLWVFLPLRVHIKATFTYSAIKLWNELPKEIKTTNKEHKFKTTVKSYLFDKMQQRDQSVFVYFKT